MKELVKCNEKGLAVGTGNRMLNGSTTRPSNNPSAVVSDERSYQPITRDD